MVARFRRVSGLLRNQHQDRGWYVLSAIQNQLLPNCGRTTQLEDRLRFDRVSRPDVVGPARAIRDRYLRPLPPVTLSLGPSGFLAAMPREWTMPTRSAARPCRVALAERLSDAIRSRGRLGGPSFSRLRSMRATLGIPGIAHVAFTIWCAVLLITNPGCQRSQLTDGLPAETDCSSCHGAAGNAAPPRALNGSDSTTDIGVGAHQSHMLGSEIAG